MAKTLKTHWYSKTIDALQLAGMSESTQESYARAVRMLIEHFEKDPRQITEGELQSYFLYRRTKQPPAKAGGFNSRTESPDTGQRPVVRTLS